VELRRDDAVKAAAAVVAHAFPEVDPRVLSLTDEEHHAAEGRWTVGLSVPGSMRFQVEVGLVPGVPGSAHVHRLPVGEVVDSVGP
jgi:hypothetical protein